MDERLGDILATCLQRIEAGATVDECLAAYPAERAAVEPLLRVATRLQALPRPAPLSAAAQAAVTSQVLSQLTAPRLAAPGAVQAHPPPAPGRLDPSALLAGVLRAVGYRGPLAQPWLRLGALGLALLLAVALAATAYAVARAIFPPRAGPAALAPASSFALEGPIEALGEATIVIAGITLDLGPETTFAGTPGVGAIARATGQIRDDGTLLAETITVAGAAVDAAPTAPVEAPTEAPLAVATAAPTATAEPAPTTAPTAAPAAPEEPFARLRRLLEAGREDGRAGPQGQQFLSRLDGAEQALAQGDGQRAGDQLRDLFQRLREQAREGRADPAFVQEAQALLREIELAYGLRAIPDEERGGGGGDDDDERGRDNDDDDD
ncbi:MAG TPA: hypothetical protein PKD53_12830 [Chloroflexaceae bacterium]|nr:hypothetical protein [Chloroflexaceae bacterium]